MSFRLGKSLFLRTNPRWTRARKFAANSFDVACVQCEHSHSQQKVPFASARGVALARVRPVWIEPPLPAHLALSLLEDLTVELVLLLAVHLLQGLLRLEHPVLLKILQPEGESTSRTHHTSQNPARRECD